MSCVVAPITKIEKNLVLIFKAQNYVITARNHVLGSSFFEREITSSNNCRNGHSNISK